MQGLGKPGAHQLKMLEWGRRMLDESQPMPRGVVMPNVMRSVYTGGMLITTENEGDRTGDMSNTSVKALKVARQIIPKNLIHDAILRPPISWYGTTSCTFPLEDQFVRYTYPAPGCPEVHMIWTDTPCWITCWNDSNSYIRALQSPKIEFIVAQHPWMENDCLFADLILPVNTKFEERDISTDTMGGQFYLVVNEEKAIEARGESYSDYEISCLVAERLGLLQEYTGGKSIEDLVDIGFDGSGVKDRVSYEEFKEKGYYVVPPRPADRKPTPGQAPGRPQGLPRRSRQLSAQDPFRQGRVLLAEPGQALPRRPGAATGAALDREGCESRRDPLQREDQELSSACGLEPSPLAHARQSRRHDVVA